ncbi:3-dehydroquinate synthase [Atopobiaceae bacterium 24-176]
MSVVHTVAVTTPSRSYDVVVGAGILDSVGATCRKACGGESAFVVCDSNVGPLYGDVVERSLAEAGYACARFTFTAGETSKNAQTLFSCLEAMASAECTRDTVVVALGGGVTGDLGGLAAALYMRGCPVVQVPTSLLAMVDSSVGGKTAVDLPQGKNLAGAFWQPWAVVADVACLETVPAELLLDSVGEVVKHGVLADPDLFADVTGSPLTARPLDLDRLAAVVARNVEIKRDVVCADERERGLRQTLNLGHTAGHAIEAASGFALGHGSSVSCGLAVVARGCAAQGLCDPALARTIVDGLAACGLPVDCDASVEEVLALSRSDKKRHGDTVNLVVPVDIGKVEVVPMPFERYAAIVTRGMEG